MMNETYNGEKEGKCREDARARTVETKGRAKKKVKV